MDEQTFEVIKNLKAKPLISREERDRHCREKHAEIINGILPEDW